MMRAGKKIAIALFLLLSLTMSIASPIMRPTALAEPTTTTETTETTETSTNTNTDNQAASNPSSEQLADDQEDKCQKGLRGFGWLFCPGQSLMTSLVDMAANWISSGLEWTFFADGNSTKLYEIWQKFQTIAYLVLAIGFITMIYSMATNNFISSYTIRKMLPTVIIVSVLVTFSFHICALLVDLSNIAGKAVYNIIYAQMEAGNSTWWGNATSSILGVGLTALAIFFFAGTAFLGLSIIVIAILFRQILLVVLVVASPIIMSLYILPNTKKWASGWMHFFVKLLLVYPMFSAIWAASRLIANILSVTQSGALPGFVVDFVCAIAPMLAIIPVFKMAGGVLDTVVSGVNKNSQAKKVRDWIDKKPTAAVRESNLGANARSWGSNAALGVQNKLGSKTGMWQPIASVLRSPSFNRLTTHAADQANKLDEENQKSATNWVKNNLTDTQRTEIIKNAGAYTNNAGKRVVLTDTHKIRAAIAEGKKALSTSDWLDALDNFDKLEDSLNKAGRGREADQIRQAYAAAMKKDDKDDKRVFPFSPGDISAFGRGDAAWRGSDRRATRNNALLGHLSNINRDTFNNLGTKTLNGLRDRIETIEHSPLRDGAVQNMRRLSQEYQKDNPSLTGPNATPNDRAKGEALYDNGFLRTQSEQQAVEEISKQLNIEADAIDYLSQLFNSDNTAEAKKAIPYAQFIQSSKYHSGLSDVDRMRLSIMSHADPSTISNTNSQRPVAPTPIATWDRSRT